MHDFLLRVADHSFLLLVFFELLRPLWRGRQRHICFRRTHKSYRPTLAVLSYEGEGGILFLDR
jgi:hypothetical protein